MKYSKELHGWIKSNNYLCGRAGVPSVTYSIGVIAALLDEIERLQSERRWIPVSKPPEHNNSVLLADFDSAEKYECGIPATVGFYFRGEWRLPTGSGVSPTHYKDCIIDNDERIGLDNLPEDDE